MNRIYLSMEAGKTSLRSWYLSQVWKAGKKHDMQDRAATKGEKGQEDPSQ